jgi:hypothetical protein
LGIWVQQSNACFFVHTPPNADILFELPLTQVAKEVGKSDISRNSFSNQQQSLTTIATTLFKKGRQLAHLSPT